MKENQTLFQLVYGMTESTGATCATLNGDSEEVRFSTVGRPLPWCEVRRHTIFILSILG